MSHIIGRPDAQRDRLDSSSSSSSEDEHPHIESDSNARSNVESDEVVDEARGDLVEEQYAKQVPSSSGQGIMGNDADTSTSSTLKLPRRLGERGDDDDENGSKRAASLSKETINPPANHPNHAHPNEPTTTTNSSLETTFTPPLGPSSAPSSSNSTTVENPRTTWARYISSHILSLYSLACCVFFLALLTGIVSIRIVPSDREGVVSCRDTPNGCSTEGWEDRRRQTPASSPVCNIFSLTPYNIVSRDSSSSSSSSPLNNIINIHHHHQTKASCTAQLVYTLTEYVATHDLRSITVPQARARALLMAGALRRCAREEGRRNKRGEERRLKGGDGGLWDLGERLMNENEDCGEQGHVEEEWRRDIKVFLLLASRAEGG